MACSSGHFEGERLGTPIPLLKRCQYAWEWRSYCQKPPKGRTLFVEAHPARTFSHALPLRSTPFVRAFPLFIPYEMTAGLQTYLNLNLNDDGL